MSKQLSAIKAMVRQFLRDESFPTKDYDFNEDELELHIGQCLVEISQRRPYEVKETLVSVGSKELDISSINELLEVERAEYPTGSDPPDYRNVSVFGNTLRLLIDNAPTSGKNVYLYCNKVHQLTETASTLNSELEKILIDGAVARAAMAWLNEFRAQTVAARETIDSLGSAVVEMSARITQAIDDLSSGRPLINKINIANSPETDYANYAARELGNANGYLNKANGYFRKMSSELSVGASIVRYHNWANGQLALYYTELNRISKPKTKHTYPRD